jgi:lactate 2-monooxygenase
MKTKTVISRMSDIFFKGLQGYKPKIPVCLDALDEVAHKYIPKGPYAYIHGGAGREHLVERNKDAFLKWSIVPRVLKDISEYDTSIELFGEKHDYPLILSPVGALDLASPQGEVAVGRAAASENIAMGFSSMASTPMEVVAAAMGKGKRWYQLYWTNSDEYNQSLIERAESSGCSAIIVTVDTKLIGWRTDDLTLAYSAFETFSGLAQYTSDPVFQQLLEQAIRKETSGPQPNITLKLLRNMLRVCWKAPGGFLNNIKTKRPIKTLEVFTSLFNNTALTWKDVAKLKSKTKLPIIVKGILSPEDAQLAIDYGLDGIIVSNHGGRQLSGCIPTIDALPPIVEVVGGRIPILLDSGVRGGADMFKAIALGANAVLVGRPYVYALAIAGEDGVRELIQNLKAEFEITMALAGCVNVKEITGEAVKRIE